MCLLLAVDGNIFDNNDTVKLEGITIKVWERDFEIGGRRSLGGHPLLVSEVMLRRAGGGWWEEARQAKKVR